MKPIQFEDTAAQRVYNDYIKRCRQCLKGLPENDREECLLEINSHIFEYLQANSGTAEMDNLLNVLDRLGFPEETLKEFVASRKIDQAVKTWNPLYIIQALYLNIRNGIAYTILALLFLLLVTFPVLIILKLIYPESVGCFTGKNSFYFGFIGQHEQATEQLGNWFIPVALLITGLLYMVIIIMLKIIKKKK